MTAVSDEPFVIVDRERRDVFAALGRHRPLGEVRHAADAAGVRWAWAEVGGSVVGLTPRGPGRIWAGGEPDLDGTEADNSAWADDPDPHGVRRLAGGLRPGGHAARLLWAVHRAALAHKSSLLTVADAWLAGAVWGQAKSRPRHWRGDLLAALRMLTWLHVADLVPGAAPAFGRDSVLFYHIGDLRGCPEDACPGDCGAAGRHHHVQMDLGPGFLGRLEAFGTGEAGGVREYRFPAGGRAAHGPSLKSAGKDGRLVTAFVPAVLGDPVRCKTLTTAQHALLQTLIRETTRGAAGTAPDRSEEAGTRVRRHSGRGTRPCPLLAAGVEYVGFNGNGVRAGMGYRLAGEWGWLRRAGYPEGGVRPFLADLAALGRALGLTVVGVGPGTAFHPLAGLRGMAETGAGRRALDRVDVRVYAAAGHAGRWSAYFGWGGPAAGGEPSVHELVGEMRASNVSCRALAAALGRDHSFLAKVLRGTKPPPGGLLGEVRAFLADHGAAGGGRKGVAARGRRVEHGRGRGARSR